MKRTTVKLMAAEVGEGPCFLSAEIAPKRGMLLLQSKVRLRDGRDFDLLATPADPGFGGPDDVNGNVSFSLGGAILLPYANRITGRPVAGRQIEAQVLGQAVRLPMNWGGKAPGARQYAMHGLMLDAAFEVVDGDDAHVRGVFSAGDFGGHWLSATQITIEYRLTPAALSLTVEAANVGDAPLPMGIGWHPWFNLPSGDRRRTVLRLPAAARATVNDYDEVLPTGEVTPVAGGAYDFSRGRALGDLYLDDCFVRLTGNTAELVDPAAGFGLRVAAEAPPVTAFQVYAPPERDLVVIEPQFNWADPFNPIWRGQDTGMVVLAPGERTTYAASLALFVP